MQAIGNEFSIDKLQNTNTTNYIMVIPLYQ